MAANDPTQLVTVRGKAVAVALLALLSTACSHTPKPGELTGLWATVPVVTARGTTTEEFCFNADGSLQSITRTPGGTQKYRGTYTLAGDVLTIQSPDFDTPQTLKASINLGKLELTSSKGVKQKYEKTGATCEDQGR